MDNTEDTVRANLLITRISDMRKSINNLKSKLNSEKKHLIQEKKVVQESQSQVKFFICMWLKFFPKSFRISYIKAKSVDMGINIEQYFLSLLVNTEELFIIICDNYRYGVIIMER